MFCDLQGTDRFDLCLEFFVRYYYTPKHVLSIPGIQSLVLLLSYSLFSKNMGVVTISHVKIIFHHQ